MKKLDPSKGELYSMTNKCYYSDFRRFRKENQIDEYQWYCDDDYFEFICKYYQLVYTKNGQLVVQD